MNQKGISRREFLSTSKHIAIGAVAGSLAMKTAGCFTVEEKPVVSIAKIENDKIGYAVEKAVDLLGGIGTVTEGKDRIMLKPNLVDPLIEDTTNPEVVKILAQLMKRAGKEVLIGEGSAAAPGFNGEGEEMYRTKKREILDPMQQFVFDELGYSELADSLKIPLVNLHSGEMAEVRLPDGYVFDRITLHKTLVDIDLLCSVPIMKTHMLATVTLGMKNLIGLYPGTEYYSVRSWLHNCSAEKGSPGAAYEIVDMVRANKLGLVVVDGSTAMEGNGPSVTWGGTLVKMNLIIAGTNPLATDMVTASIMGFEQDEIPTFTWAVKAGMKPTKLDKIEIRGEKLDSVRRKFVKPTMIRWADIKDSFGAQEI